MRLLLSVFVAIACVACSQETEPVADAGGERAAADRLVNAERVSGVLEGFVEQGELVGVSALIYEDGEEVFFGAYGMADRDAGRPMARDTVARIFSMTKPVTGVTLMTLYDEGRFELDDPLSDYLPEYADVMVYAGGEGDAVHLEPPQRPISIRDITRHTAGFGGEPWVDRALSEAGVMHPDNTLAVMSERIAAVPLGYQPGTRWRYGDSVDVQARLVEVLAGKPYAQVLRERVLDPLGMSETSYVFAPGQRDRRMVLHERQQGGGFRPSADAWLTGFNDEARALTPGGWGLVSTIDDYMRFALMLQNDGELDGVRILKPETVRLMATDALPDTVGDRHFLPNKGQVGFGIDFAVRIAPPADQAEGSGAVGEFFWDGLAGTLFWVDPRNDITAVLFNQWVPWGGVTVMKDFRDAIYHDDAEASALNKSPAGPDSRRLSD